MPCTQRQKKHLGPHTLASSSHTHAPLIKTMHSLPQLHQKQTLSFLITTPILLISSNFLIFQMNQEKIMHYQVEQPIWRSYYMRRVRSMEEDQMERVARLASQSAVVIFSNSSCCMCHAMKSLFSGMGVNAMVHELDQDPKGKEMERALMRLLGTSTTVPIVFIGGKLVGSMDRVLAFHINGSLVPLLKQAGALWL